MSWYVYPSQEEAAAASSRIAVNMGLPLAGGTTSEWSTPRPVADGGWAILLPDDERLMEGVAPGMPVTAPVWPNDMEGAA